MAYVRPVNKTPLSKQQKLDLLTEYAAYYRDAVAADDTALNQKIEGMRLRRSSRPHWITLIDG